MSASNEKLDQFLSAILADADRESAGVLEEIQARRTTYTSQMESEILAEVFDYVRSKVAEARTDAGRRISKKTLENKRTLHRRRQAVADEVFDKVRARIREFVASPAYRESLDRSIATAKELLGGEGLVIYMRTADMSLLDDLANTEGVIFEADDTIEYGGIAAEQPERHLGIDMSYDSSLEAARQQFAKISGFGLARGAEKESLYADEASGDPD